MKTITSVLILYLFLLPTSFSQNSISDITSNAIEASLELDYILNLKVFDYYDIKNYNTELQKSVYKKTEEYKSKLAALTQLRDESISKVFYSTRINAFESTDYNLTLGGFEISLGFVNDTSAQYKPKSQKDYRFRGEEVLFFKLSEEDGLEIETDKKNIVIYFLFTPIEQGTSKFIYQSGGAFWGPSLGWFDVKGNKVKTKVRLVLANKVTEKIYFDKPYWVINI